MNEENEKKQKIAELIAAIKKAKGIDSEITPENISVSEDEIIDSGIESVQGNGGMSEAAMEADYEAEQNSRPDYLDENGNPHWFDEEENIVAENEREYQKAEDFSARMFTYNDFNFVAVRKFSEEERAFVDSVISNEQNKKLLSKNALYYAGFLESQKPVSEQNFEKALKVFNRAEFLQTSSFDADIFYCREKGTFYTALNNDFLVPLEFVYSSDRQEKDLFENRFSDEIESFRNDNFDFLKGTLSYELDEEKDFALMSDISDVLSEGDVFTRRNVNIDGEISEPSEKIDFAENEARENFQPSPNVKSPEEFERMKKEIDNARIVDDEPEIKPESVENSEEEKNMETQKEDVSYQDYTAGKVIYGKTILPPFASMTSDGHLKTCENFVVKSYDNESGTYLVENENEKLSLPRETFNTLLNPAGLYKEQQEEKIFQMEGNGIVFDNPEKGVKGTVIPEFSLMTQNGLQTYKDCVVTKFNESDKTYTLRNGDSIISVTEERFKEITSPERFENKFDENTPAYKKMLKTQYEDFFKERSNTAYNFRHNLSVFCRKEANSPCDALKVAKGIIQKMSPSEQDKTKKLLKKIAREGESLNQLIVRTYHEAIKEVPLNEEYIKQYQPENRIARPFYDTLSTDGQKIDTDTQLLRTDKDYNLKIGDTLKDIDIKSDKIFGHGKEKVHFSELKVISASKEGNTVTLMDKEKSFIEIPRDTVLKAYKEQQLKEMKHQQAHSRRNSMEISYR